MSARVAPSTRVHRASRPQARARPGSGRPRSAPIGPAAAAGRPATRHRAAFLLSSFALVSLLVVGVVVLQVLTSQNAFRFEKLTKRSAALRDRQQELVLRVAELQAPGRIKDEAKKLGLRLVPLEQIMTIAVRSADPGPTSLRDGDPGRATETPDGVGP